VLNALLERRARKLHLEHLLLVPLLRLQLTGLLRLVVALFCLGSLALLARLGLRVELLTQLRNLDPVPLQKRPAAWVAAGKGLVSLLRGG